MRTKYENPCRRDVQRSILKAESTNTANPSPGSRPKIRGSLALFAEDGHLLMRAQGQVLVYKNEKTLLHPESFHLPPLLPPSPPPPPPPPPSPPPLPPSPSPLPLPQA
ncbi:hypothetical protein HZH66_000597 [Vespula vulgaris]|uniref:Uncharacterized protein n=1 Tax=Vespula vulgaris TaxID=7454 RepID=A0A834KTJ2_VESVU|nr:hypothetical protein HZH66_000597 [Vespula vulgaris]